MRVATFQIRLGIMAVVSIGIAFLCLDKEMHASSPLPAKGTIAASNATMLPPVVADPGQVPADLESPVAMRTGAHLFRENCVQCHGAPGIPASVQGLTPAPPNLLAAGRRNAPVDVYSKVKIGIPGTAMPPWGGLLSDQDIWSLAGFLHHSRGISPDDYLKLQTH
jgi:mono/diheme cytochrome c family protein